ncbi:MAG: hypothetical protein ABIO83_05770, partial [Ilumatobacteraceae bacterium]
IVDGTGTVVTGNDTTFSFGGDVGGDLPGSILTVDGRTQTGDALTAAVTPGTYSVTETTSATPGYTLSGVECNDTDSVRSGDGAAISVDAGETVTCAFRNRRNQATFTLQKAWGDGTLDGETVGLTADVSGPGPLATAIDTTATSPAGASGTNSLMVASGQTVDFGEIFTGDSGDGYTTSLVCSAPAGNGSLSVGDLQRSATYVVGDDPADMTCTLTNTPKVAGVALQKAWAGNAHAGDTAILSVSTSPAGDADSADSVAPAPAVFLGADNDSDTTAFVEVVSGGTVTFHEDLGDAAADYATAFDCETATANDAVRVDDRTYTLLVDTTDVAGGAMISCAFTNTRLEVELVLVKDWNHAVIGDSATIEVTGSDTAPISLQSTAATTDDTDESTSFTVYAGETLMFDEVMDGDLAASYDTTFDCVGSSTWTTGAQLVVDPSDTTITCTYVNERKSTNLTVSKVWIEAVAGDTAVLGLDGRHGNHDTATSTAPAAPNVSNTATITVYAGETIDLSETLTTSDEYDTTLRCIGATPEYPGGASGDDRFAATLDITPAIADGTGVACTFVNAGRPDITVLKEAAGTVATQIDGYLYSAVYVVTVTNSGPGAGTYAITDLPDFADGATVEFDGVSFDPAPAAVNEIAGNSQHVYTVTVEFTVDGDTAIADRTCGTVPAPGQAAYNAVSIDVGSAMDPSSDACVDIPLPDISVTKVRTSDTASLVDGNVYEAGYTVTVRNDGDGPGVYSLDDVPVIPGTDAVISTTIDPLPLDGTSIEAGGVDVYDIVVRFTVDGGLTTHDRTCATRAAPGRGAFNGVTVTSNDGITTDQDCVDIPVPNIDFRKVVVGAGAVYRGDDAWTVTYRIEVTNLDGAAAAGPGRYTLSDDVDFGPGVTVDTITVTPSDATRPAFTGVAPTDVVAVAVDIDGGETHRYTVTADVTITPTLGTNGDCARQGGLVNRAGLQVAGEVGVRDPSTACASFSTLTLVKQLDPRTDGGNAGVDSFTLTATLDGTRVLSGTTPVVGSVPAGSYALAEQQLPGYVSDGYTCVGGVLSGAIVIVPVGAS